MRCFKREWQHEIIVARESETQKQSTQKVDNSATLISNQTHMNEQEEEWPNRNEKNGISMGVSESIPNRNGHFHEQSKQVLSPLLWQ